MTTFPPSETALLLIDIQKGFEDPSHWGTTRSTAEFERNIELLLAEFRSAGACILHVCHLSRFPSSPLHPSKETSQFMSCATPAPSEPIFSKTTNSPFVETNLEATIRERGIKRLVIVGLMTAHCVSTTMRMASNLQVVDHNYGSADPADTNQCSGTLVLVDDATATFGVEYGGKSYDAESVHAVHLASMQHEFCDIENTKEVLRRLREGVA